MQFPIVLDGGLSNQLEAQGVDLSHPLWTAQAVINAPEKIIAAHKSYLEAGAQCIITSSYQASIQGFIELGFTHNDAVHLMQQTVLLAKEAVAQYKVDSGDPSPKYVAASIGPYGASLCDGSEYHGHYDVSRETLVHYHQDRFDALAECGQDFYACETIPSREEALVIAELLEGCNTPAWLCFSCKDKEHICDGTLLSKACLPFAEKQTFFAMGVNCSAPDLISPLVKIIKRICPTKRVVIYPNSGEVYNAHKKQWSACETPTDFAEQSRHWVEQGVDIIGGCCRIGPDHIRQIERELKRKQEPVLT